MSTPTNSVPRDTHGIKLRQARLRWGITEGHDHEPPAGLGWGGMPVGVVEADLANGSLVKIRIEDLPEGHLVMAMSAAFKTDTPPGPAGRWLIERLKSKRINA